jgi:hypothetical protein
LSDALCQSQDLKRFDGETASRIWTQLKEKVMY